MDEIKKTSRKDAMVALAIAVGCIALVAVAFIAPSKKNFIGVSNDGVVPLRGKLENLQIFSYASGLTGIYDRDDKMLYIYDSNLKKCFLKRKIDKLGEDLMEIDNINSKLEE